MEGMTTAPPVAVTQDLDRISTARGQLRNQSVTDQVARPARRKPTHLTNSGAIDTSPARACT